MKGLIRNLFRRPAQAREQLFDVFMDGHEKAPRLLILTEHVNATYFISFDIPLRAMHARGEVNFAVASQALVAQRGAGCWERMSRAFQPDIVIMTRYGMPHGPAMVEAFRRSGIPVVYHIDDNLLEIPASLGAEIQKRQGAEEVIAARAAQLSSCDLIYASTAALAKELEGRFPGKNIFQGIYAPFLGDRLSRGDAPTIPATIGYMGSKGHQEDVELFVPAVERLMEERTDLRFEVFGTIQMPTRLERFGERVRSHRVNKSYIDFLGTLARLGWQIGLAPLVNEPFNLCKAPTKYIEYTAAGIPVVASDIAVYSEVIPPGGGELVQGDWYQPMLSLLEAPARRARTLQIAEQHCRVTYAPARLEAQLRMLMDKVLKG